MRRLKITLLMIMGLVLAGVLTILWTGLGQKKPPEEVPKILSEKANMALEKIRFVEDKHGRITWELEAKSIEQQGETDRMLLEEVKVTLYTKDDRTFVLSGRRATVDQKTRNVELQGDVTVVSSDGYSLKTQSASYFHNSRKVTTPDWVEIEGEQIRVTGRGMVVDLESKTFTILRQVRTQLRVGGKG